MKYRVLLFAGYLSFVTTPSVAGDDVRGSSDHPAISRFPDAYIHNYKFEEFAEFELATGPLAEDPKARPPTMQLEGKVTTIIYKLDVLEKSALQIFRSYEKALAQKGLKTAFTCSNAACGERFARQLVKDTAGMKCVFGVEPDSLVQINNPRACRQLVDDCGPRVQICLDPVNMTENARRGELAALLSRALCRLGQKGRESAQNPDQGPCCGHEDTAQCDSSVNHSEKERGTR